MRDDSILTELRENSIYTRIDNDIAADNKVIPCVAWGGHLSGEIAGRRTATSPGFEFLPLCNHVYGRQMRQSRGADSTIPICRIPDPR